MTPEPLVLAKLEWQTLTDRLTELSQTVEAHERCAALTPSLNVGQIRNVWKTVTPLRALAGAGYRPPIGDLPSMGKLFRDVTLGHILEADEFLQVLNLLTSVKTVQHFAADFAERCPPLARIRGVLYPLPALAQAITKTIERDGTVRDDATPELAQIRKQKVALRKRIEEKLKQLIVEHETETYLQDKFFTVRSDRYVLPMRLDGRGRVEGSIHDTSASGQTLYIEPKSIQPMNDQLLELELAEKLEILKIFRELSAKVAAELDTLRSNYDELVQLDFYAAQAALAAEIDAGEVHIVEQPSIHLRQARHPLLQIAKKAQPVANDIILGDTQLGLIISGPNAGGKTVILKTVGLLQMMLGAGLLIPASPESRMSLFRRVFLEMGDAQNLSANLSTFSGHLLGLRPIVEDSTPDDLVLLDELCVGTEPNTGSAIAQTILEDLSSRRVHCLVTTHFDNLKVMAVEDEKFRNGSMEFSKQNLRPTYRLVLDAPGQSYGVELAEQLGFPERILRRAKEIRGASVTALDKAVQHLMEAREQLQQQEIRARQAELAAEEEKAHWQHAAEDVRAARAKAAQRFEDMYESEMQKLRDDLESTLTEMRTSLKQMRKEGAAETHDAHQQMIEQKQRAEASLAKIGNLSASLSRQEAAQLPGEPFEIGKAQIGDEVFVIPLNENGVVRGISPQHQQPIELNVGPLKIRMSSDQLRYLGRRRADVAERAAQKSAKDARIANSKSRRPELVIQTPTNSLDLRGYDAESAMEKTWLFLDRAIMRGETAVMIIHGHGTDKLKSVIRATLSQNSPYQIEMRPGNEAEGGDGVTVVYLT